MTCWRESQSIPSCRQNHKLNNEQDVSCDFLPGHDSECLGVTLHRLLANKNINPEPGALKCKLSVILGEANNNMMNPACVNDIYVNPQLIHQNRRGQIPIAKSLHLPEVIMPDDRYGFT